MKYIKQFESLNLKLGDHVKYTHNEKPEDYKYLHLYTVVDIDNWTHSVYKYKIKKETPGTYKVIWAKRDDLLFIPEHELVANKFNI